MLTGGETGLEKHYGEQTAEFLRQLPPDFLRIPSQDAILSELATALHYKQVSQLNQCDPQWKEELQDLRDTFYYREGNGLAQTGLMLDLSTCTPSERLFLEAQALLIRYHQNAIAQKEVAEELAGFIGAEILRKEERMSRKVRA